MSIAAPQAAKFYEQVVRNGRVFTFLDDDSMLVFPVGDVEVVPFWSSRSRMLTVQRNHAKYRRLDIDDLTLDDFLVKTLPQLSDQGIHVGVNWSGKRLVGYDASTETVVENLRYWRDRIATDS